MKKHLMINRPYLIGMSLAGLGGGLSVIIFRGIELGGITTSNLFQFTGALIGVGVAASLTPIVENVKWRNSKIRLISIAIQACQDAITDINYIKANNPDFENPNNISAKISMICDRYTAIVAVLEYISIEQFGRIDAIQTSIRVKSHLNLRIGHLTEYLEQIRSREFTVDRYNAEIECIPVDLREIGIMLSKLEVIC
ncbi:hypothetical protein [Sphingomonas parapaucimobilis]|uniref:hypothetical protein n=1 Tax=Sphingomonas parapaucimobilis TaxID=28213 RepID=UPI00321C2D4D